MSTTVSVASQRSPIRVPAFDRLHVIFTAKTVNANLLDLWAQRYQVKMKYIPVFSQGAAHEAALEMGTTGPLVIVDYPIEDDTDVQAVEEFATFVMTNRGCWYYAPRPNDYLPVERPSLVGLHSFQHWAKSLCAIAQTSAPQPDATAPPQIAHSLEGQIERMKLAIEKLPQPFRGLAHGARRATWRVIRGLGGARGTSGSSAMVTTADVPVPADEIAPERDEPGRPKVIVPIMISSWSGDWQPWHPRETTVRRDLLDRIERFFPHPNSIHVILLNKCNLACGMCPYHAPAYKAGHRSDFFDDYKAMSLETFSKIAEYAGKNRIALQFGQLEEPMMHRRLPQFFKLARDKGVLHMHMTTNGTLLTPERADLILESGLNSLMVSLDAANPETYRKIRGDDLGKVEANLRYFVPKARERGIRTWASFILQPEAVSEREAFLEKWRTIGVDHVTYYVLTNHDVQTGEFVGRLSMYDAGNERYPCASPWVQAIIFPEGEVSLCCRTMTLVGWEGIISVGSLATKSFEEIWVGPRYRRVRDELLRNSFEKFEVCSKCSIWSASTAIFEKAKTYERVFNETMETYTFKH